MTLANKGQKRIKAVQNVIKTVAKMNITNGSFVSLIK